MVTHTNTRRPPNDNGFTIVELIVAITVIGLLATLAVGAYNKVVSDAKIAKSKALINTLASAKSAFVLDPQTVAGSITAFNAAPDANFTLIAQYIRVNGAQPASESDLLSLSGMPAGVTITLGTVDDSSLNGGQYGPIANRDRIRSVSIASAPPVSSPFTACGAPPPRSCF